MPAFELTKMTREEWLSKGVQLFGEDKMKWRFVCPGCGHTQTPEDFRQFKEQGATPNSAYQQCIGRYSGGKSWAFSTPEKLGKGPCDYTGTGLLNICPVVVIDDDGKEVSSFAFDESGISNPSPTTPRKVKRKIKKKGSLQEKVDDWNARYPVGQKVKVVKDLGDIFETTTRSEAQVLSGHTAVIWVVGITGCYQLDRVTAI